MKQLRALKIGETESKMSIFNIYSALKTDENEEKKKDR